MGSGFDDVYDLLGIIAVRTGTCAEQQHIVDWNIELLPHVGEIGLDVVQVITVKLE